MRGIGERGHELARVRALTAGSRDDDLDVVRAVRPRLGRLVAHGPGRLAQLQVGDPAVVLDLLAEAEERAALVHGTSRLPAAARDEQPDGIRAHVDDPDPHQADCPEQIGCQTSIWLWQRPHGAWRRCA